MGGFSQWRKKEEAQGRGLGWEAEHQEELRQEQARYLEYDHPDNVSRDDFLHYIDLARENRRRKEEENGIDTDTTENSNKPSFLSRDWWRSTRSANESRRANRSTLQGALEMLGNDSRGLEYAQDLTLSDRRELLEEEEAKRQEWFDERRERYSNIAQNDDFEENIDGWENVGRIADPTMQEAQLGYELTVPLEARDEDTQNAYAEQAEETTAITRLSPNEKRIYQYLKNTQGDDAAQDYMDYISYRVNARDVNEARAAAERNTETTAGKVVQSAVSSPINTIGGAMGAADITAQNIRNALGFEYRPVDYNRSQELSAYAGAVRENTSENMGGVGKFLYSTGMSMLDSITSMALAGGAGGTLLGLSAANQAVQDAVEAGATESQAFAMGILAGAAEMAFENISIKGLERMIARGDAPVLRDAIVSVLGQTLSEGGEELATTLANTLSDAIIMADKSEINRTIDQYMQEYGLSREAATRQAWLNWAANLGLDFLGGALSGAVMGTATEGFTYLANAEGRAAIKNGEPFYSDAISERLGNRPATLQETVNDVRNNTALTEYYSENTHKLADSIEKSGVQNAKDSTIAQFLRSFIEDRNALLERINNGEFDRDGIRLERNPDMEVSNVVTDGSRMLTDGAQTSSIVRDDSGKVDVEQTLKNAAETSVQMEDARSRGQDDTAITRPQTNAVSDVQAQNLTEQNEQAVNTDVMPATQRGAAQAQQNNAANAAARQDVQDMPADASNTAHTRFAVSGEESDVQTQKTPQTAKTAGNTATVTGTQSAVAARIAKWTEGYDETTKKQFANALQSNTALPNDVFAEAFRSAYNAGKAGLDYQSFIELGGKAAALEPYTRMAAYASGRREGQAQQNTAVKQNSESAVQTQKGTTQDVESASQVPKEQSEANSPSLQLAQTLVPLLKKGTPFNSAFLFEQANKAFGGTQAEGVYTPKDAYDAMELAVNTYLLDYAADLNGDADVATHAVNELQSMLNNIPTQTKRTAEQESYQQFSTPPTIAYLAAWVADISDADTVLEPSAGVGGLAVYPKAWGAETVVNELSPRRLAVLENMGFDRVFNENAEQLDNILPSDVKPSVVLMNPPFSSTAGRTSTNNTINAARHIEQALLRLNDGGRLVAILGRGMSDTAPSFKNWWNEIKGKYNVRANISIDGKNYRKYGTTFGVQLVVIDKTGPQNGDTITGTFTDLAEIPKALEGIRDVQSGRVLSKSGGRTERGAGIRDAERGEGGTSIVGRGTGVGGTSSDVNAETVVGTSNEGLGRHNGDVAGTSGGSVQGVLESSGGRLGRGDVAVTGISGERSNGNIGRTDIRPESESALSGLNTGESLRDQPTVKTQTQQVVKKRGAVKDNGVFAQYVPAPLPVSGAKAHPAHLVESAAMSAVQSPAATYVPDLPAELITSGALSDAQLENVVYAGQAQMQTLPNGERRGYFIGDGTGVGKGRQIAAIILDNMRQGREKAVWISRNTDLYSDARRDWSDIGGADTLFINGKKGDFPKRPNQWAHQSGILYLTYSGLSWSKGNRANIDTVVNWLGKDFDGVIAFDEAHEMSNATTTRGKFGGKKPSQKALSGIELQKRLPNARILYVSATGATEVSNLAYAQRLGLWGKGTAFENASDFIQKIGASGLAAMELVARDLKASGSYLARSISYDDVKYDTLLHPLTRSQATIYDTMSEAWQTVLQNVNEALKITNQAGNGNKRGNAYSTFYSYLQNFYNQILTSMSMPSVIEDIQRQLDDGKSVVLQIVNTNEAQQERAKKKAQEEGLSLEDMDMTPRETLLRYLEKAFPVQVYEQYDDNNGNTRSRPVVDSQGNAVIDRQAVAMRDALIERVNQMSVPDGALEMLLNAFGPENVAEITGRTSRVVYKEDADGNTVRVEERRSPSARDADATAFQNGDKRILVFSQAGGTGKSYHADLRANNQQQRVHYVLQPGWEAAKAVQGLGRTHRSNQASAPIVKLVTTDVKGHKRFVSTIARRISQLGALTKGQRDASGGLFSERDNLESPVAIRALQTFYDMLGTNQLAGLDGKTILSNLGLANKFYDEFGNYKADAETASNMGRFLNRILALKVDEQNRVFDAFMSIYDEAYDRAVANDTLDTGMETVKADSIDIVDDTVVRKDEKTGATTNYVQANVKNKPRIIPYKQVRGLKNDFQGLYRNNETGDIRAVYRIADITSPRTGEVMQRYSLQTAVYGKANTTVESRFTERYTAVPKSEWASAWREAIAAAPEYNEQTYHMITGTLLPIWDLLPNDERVRVKRLTSDDGRTYLGRLINESQIDTVLSRLGAVQRTKQTHNASDVFHGILKGDNVRLLYNGWTLKRSLVAGEQRIEITGRNLWATKSHSGIFTERINGETRYFIPTDEKTGTRTLENVMKENPVMSIARGSTSGGVDYSMRGGSSTRNTATQKTQATTQRKSNPLSLSEIVERLSHDFGVHITIGHVRGSGVAGFYDHGTNGIRSRLYNDLPTISHEVGHRLDHQFDVTSYVDKATSQELMQCAGDQKRPTDVETRREGLAEFIRLYLQNKETAAIDYPLIAQLMRSRVDESTMNLLNSLADEVNAYYVASAGSAQSAIVSAEKGPADSRTFGEKLSDNSHEGYQHFVDSLHSIKVFSDTYGSSAYISALNSAYSDSVTASAIKGPSLRDMNGNVIGGSMRSALKGVNTSNKQEYAAFNEYLVVRHGPERLAEGMRIFADDRQNSTQWMENRRAELETQYPEFSSAAERLYQYQRNVLFAWGVQTGLISQETYDAWGERWQSYVPLNRQMDETASGRGVRRGFANQNSTIRRAHGSGRNIINPIENIAANTAKIITAAMRNNVMQDIVTSIAENPDSMTANFAERVYTPMTVQRDNVSTVKSQIAQEAVENFTTETDLETLENILRGIDDILIEYKQAAGARDNRVVTVLIGGQKQFWRINDDLLFESLTSMEPQRVPAVLRTLVNVNRFITSNLTGNNAVWSVFSNMPRDFQTALTYATDRNPIHMIANMAKSYLNAFHSPENQSETYQLFLAMGGGSDSIYSSSRKIGQDVQRLIKSNSKPTNVLEILGWLNPLRQVEFLSNMIEAGPRYAEFAACLNAGMSPTEAIARAHDVTVNFRRSGTYVRGTLNGLVPFLNANIQGTDKFLRFLTASDVPKSTRKKASALRFGIWLTANVVAGALVFAANHGDDDKERDYGMLSTYTKNNYFCLPVGDSQFLTIPKPREIAVPSSFVSAALEYAFNDNENALDDFAEYTIDAVAPPISDNLASAIWKLFTESPEAAGEEATNALGDLGALGIAHYLSANKDFLGRPIVSSSLENYETKDQFTGKTSKAAYWLGQALNMSPTRLDYLLQNTLGGYWKNMKALFPLDNSNIDYTLGVSSTWVRDSLYSTDIVNTMYDNKETAERAKNSHPDDGEKAAWYQQCNQMTTFYSRFNTLARETNGEQTRMARRVVLDMINDFNSIYESGNETAEMQAVYDIVRATGDESILPTARQTTLKYETSFGGTQEIVLSPDAYLEYQTEYNSLYWQRAVLLASRYANHPETAAEKIEQMKDEVSEEAKEAALRRARAKN